MMIDLSEFKRWWLFTIVSLIFFLITGSTYGSLGVVLPFMIEELGLTWTEAGTGFTILALMTGITATIPAWMIRRFGIKATYGTGGLAMLTGFILLARCESLHQYYLGTGLLGYGFSHCASVPAVFVLSNWIPDKRSMAIGAYMTFGGLGGVAGPLLVTGIEAATGSWRMYWWLAAVAILFLASLAVFFVSATPGRKSDVQNNITPATEKHSLWVHKTNVDWEFRDVVRCKQFYVIVAAMTMTLFCTVTMSTWAVIHMGILGISAAIAATALSVHALLNAISRAVGGMLATLVDPKWLLVSALIAETLGMIALSVADNPVAIALFVLFEGYGFGMCLFTTTVLLINYFGLKHNPEIFGTLNLITTIAMIGPILGGYVGDTIGNFAIVFQAYSVILLLIATAAALMRPPAIRAADEPTGKCS